MFALIELILFLFFLPYILFGMLLGYIYERVTAVFQPHALLAGIWLAIGGALLVPHSAPDDLPFETVLQVIARSDVLGMGMPAFLIVLGVFTVAISAVIRLGKSNSIGK